MDPLVERAIAKVKIEEGKYRQTHSLPNKQRLDAARAKLGRLQFQYATQYVGLETNKKN